MATVMQSTIQCHSSMISMVTNFGTGLGVVICHNAISACVISRVGRGACVAMAMLLTVLFCLHGLCLWLYKYMPYKGKIEHTLFPGKGKWSTACFEN